MEVTFYHSKQIFTKYFYFLSVLAQQFIFLIH